MGHETVRGHQNKVECPPSSVVKGLGSGWTWTGQETVWGHQNEVECPLTEIVTDTMSTKCLHCGYNQIKLAMV